jgi:hypothetical protein
LGKFQNKVYVMIEGGDIASLQEKSDALASRLERTPRREKSRRLCALHGLSRREACRRKHRGVEGLLEQKGIAAIKKNIAAASAEHGITRMPSLPLFVCLNIQIWVQGDTPSFLSAPRRLRAGNKRPLALLRPYARQAYDPESFHAAYASIGAKIFDARFFSAEVGAFLSSMFLEIALIVGLAWSGWCCFFPRSEAHRRGVRPVASRCFRPSAP